MIEAKQSHDWPIVTASWRWDAWRLESARVRLVRGGRRSLAVAAGQQLLHGKRIDDRRLAGRKAALATPADSGNAKGAGGQTALRRAILNARGKGR